MVNIWQGEKVRLRAVEPRDWESFDRWDQDTEIARLCYYIPFPRCAEGTRKMANDMSLAGPKNDDFRWMIETLAGEAVGTINTHHCDSRYGTFEYGLAIAREHWNHGYASQAVRLVLAYYFGELRYQKCTVHVYDFNPASLHLHEKLGFTQEGRLRRMIYTEGMYHDEFVLGMTAEEFWGRTKASS